jgi:hypothetical protein
MRIPRRILGLVLLLANVLCEDAQAASNTYTCVAVDKKASVAADTARSVSITTGDKTCYFSVDSAPVDSRHQPEFVKGINELLAGRLDNLSKSSPNKDALRQMLLPQSSDDSNLRIAFENAFDNDLSTFGTCISQFRAGQQPTAGSQPNFICGRATGFSGDPFSLKHPVYVEGNGADVLELGVVLSGRGYYLFVPNELLSRGKQGFQFRQPG